MSFTGKTAFITGGAGGIGGATARALLNAGIEKVALVDLNDSPIVAELQSEFAEKTIVFHKVDISKRAEVEQAFDQTIADFGAVDVVVNSAGIVNEPKYESVIDVNLTGLMHSTYIAIERMSVEKGGKGGIIANVASIAGLDYLFNAPAYTATKHAIIGFTRALGDKFYWEKFGIKFLSICPGYTVTGMLDNLGPKVFQAGRIDPAAFVPFIKKIGLQSVEDCGKLLVESLEKGENGSVWMLNKSEATEILPPKYLLD